MFKTVKIEHLKNVKCSENINSQFQISQKNISSILDHFQTIKKMAKKTPKV